MFGDLLQALYARKSVIAEDGTRWMIVYALPQSETGIEAGMHFAAAVRVREDGKVDLPAPVSVVRWFEKDQEE